ncbi:MAG: acetolactate synthase small subunit [Bacteroidales bacterium]|nr:acetolactate synthase small subunit [Bacteroidales bacterium]
MEQYNGTKLYTFLIYSENIAGLLSQISAVFTRRQVNIESLNVCASSTPGVHKYTITSFCDEEMAKMIVKQIEKKIDVLKANFFTDDEIFINETCLLKISTPVMLSNTQICSIVRLYSARIVEVNPTYATIEKTGMTSDILGLFNALNALGCVLQFVRSGRIAITKSCVEHLDEYLAEREKRHQEEA